MNLSLTRCILRATRQFHKFDDTVYIRPVTDESNPSVDELDVILLPALSRSNKTIRILTNSTHSRNAVEQKPGAILVHFLEKEDLNVQLALLKKKWMLNRHGKFLFISTTIFNDSFDIASYFFDILWKENILNFYILLARPDRDAAFSVFSWDPYANGKCGNPLDKTLYDCVSCTYGKTDKPVNWFTKKIHKNCPIHVKYINNPPYVMEMNSLQGLDVDILSIIGEKLKLNFTYEKVSATEVGSVSENNQFSGVFRELRNGSVDVIIGGYAKQLSYLKYFDFSQEYTGDALILCTPDVPLKTYDEGCNRKTEGRYMSQQPFQKVHG
ncbi:unnamed protein product [Phyllotreta striolata]|uniref:Ionotropic glutamate receptor L-glutamate and glycine-binding domain-containing protein n=1 Tax=Phyllotreta striolata TaxID=444603 RepID=A0A9N9TMZ9_PHYSR|nr:unnamed protein product [Phyllotreta striolata]